MSTNHVPDEGQPPASRVPAVTAEVVALGETMVLFWPAHGGSLEVATSYERSCGGAESNFCIALARLGHRPRWISRLGDDAFGRYIRTILEREGVQVDAPAEATPSREGRARSERSPDSVPESAA